MYEIGRLTLFSIRRVNKQILLQVEFQVSNKYSSVSPLIVDGLQQIICHFNGKNPTDMMKTLLEFVDAQFHGYLSTNSPSITFFKTSWPAIDVGARQETDWSGYEFPLLTPCFKKTMTTSFPECPHKGSTQMMGKGQYVSEYCRNNLTNHLALMSMFQRLKYHQIFRSQFSSRVHEDEKVQRKPPNRNIRLSTPSYDIDVVLRDQAIYFQVTLFNVVFLLLVICMCPIK